MARIRAARPLSAASPARTALVALAVGAALVATGCAGDDSTTSGNRAAQAGGSAPAGSSGSPPAEVAGNTGDGRGTPSPAADDAVPQGAAEGAARAPWCGTEDLSPSLRTLQPAAGNRYAALTLTNTSGSACRTQGWPGLQLTADGGDTLPTSTVRDHSRPARQLTVGPGERAWSKLHWSVVPGTGVRDSCPAPSGLRVIPPDSYRAAGTGWPAGAVCGGRIEVLPLAAGAGPGQG